MSIVLEVLGGLLIVLIGGVMTFGGGLGNSVVMWFGGMIVAAVGAGLVVTTIMSYIVG